MTDVSGTPVGDAFDEVRDDIKLLKRHKHEERTGDVMVRT